MHSDSFVAKARATVRSRASLLALLLLLGALPAGAEPPAADTWSFSITPYIWLPAMTGKTQVKGTQTEIDTSIADLFTETDFVLSLSADMEAWYEGRWGVAVNALWSTLRTKNQVVPLPLPPIPILPTFAQFDVAVDLGLFEFLALHSFGERSFTSEPESPTWEIQPLVGVRVTYMANRLEFDAPPLLALLGKLDVSTAWADPILGARGRLRFGPERRWNFALRGDFGGFGAGSEFTWNLFGAIGYDLRVGKADTTIFLGGRALYQNYKQGSGVDFFRWDVTQYGPVLGWQFRF